MFSVFIILISSLMNGLSIFLIKISVFYLSMGSLYISIFNLLSVVYITCTPNVRISCSAFPTGSIDHKCNGVNQTSRRLRPEKLTQKIF